MDDDVVLADRIHLDATADLSRLEIRLPVTCEFQVFVADPDAADAVKVLDGEGGYMVWGRQMPAPDSLAVNGLPLGLATGVTLVRDVAAGERLTWADVDIDETDQAVRVRREMEAAFSPPGALAERHGSAIASVAK